MPKRITSDSLNWKVSKQFIADIDWLNIWHLNWHFSSDVSSFISWQVLCECSFILCLYDDLFFLRHVKCLVRGGGLSKLTEMLLADPPSSGASRKLRWPRQMACCATWSEQGDAESSRWSTPVWNSHKDWTHPAAVLRDWEGAAGRGKGGGVATALGGGSPPAGPIWVEKQPRGSSISSRGSPWWPVAAGETASALSYRSVCMWSACTHTFLRGLGGLKPL